MRFSLTTVAAAALLVSVSAAPSPAKPTELSARGPAPTRAHGHRSGHRGKHGGGQRNGTESNGPGSDSIGSGMGIGGGPGRGGQRNGGDPGYFPGGGAAPTGGFPGLGGQPSDPQMTGIPTYTPGNDYERRSVESEPVVTKRQSFNWVWTRDEGSEEKSKSSGGSKGSQESGSGDDKKEKSKDASDSKGSAEDSSDSKSGASDAKDDSGSSSGGKGGDSSSGSSSDTSDGGDSSSGSESTGGSSSGGGSSSSSGGQTGSGSGSGNSTMPSSGGTAASGTMPAAAGESTLSKTMAVTGEFDGGMKRFGRGVSCTGQAEGGDSDAVFSIANGGTLRNVIIGADQIEGVHCQGACTIENVWWEDVCEDALTFKKDGDGTVTGGGAMGASDKVIQHNGAGTITVSGFTVSDFGKLYRSCGNCKTMGERHVKIDKVKATGGKATFVGINSNYGDTATITNSCIKDTKAICEEFEGNDTGAEPKQISEGPSSACIYTPADIAAC